MSDIFISYAREDESRVEPIVKALIVQGWSVWWDREIPFGRPFDQAITDAINAAHCILVVWSTSSIHSQWVIEEAHYGYQHNVLIPVFIDCVTPPLGFQRLQAADLTGWAGKPTHLEFRKLVQNIRKATASRLAQKQHEIEQHSSIIEKLGVRSAPKKYFFRLLGRSRTKAAVLAGLFFLVLPLSIFYVVRPPLCNPYTTPSAGRVDRVGVKILALRRVRDQNATLVELDYRITTGAEFAWHNPASFVKLISNGVTLAPISASASARNLVSNSQDDFSAKFLVPTDKAAQVIFRFGEEHHLDLPACLMD